MSDNLKSQNSDSLESERNSLINENVKVFYNINGSASDNICITTTTLGIKVCVYLDKQEMADPNRDYIVSRYKQSLFTYACYVRSMYDFRLLIPTSLELYKDKDHGYLLKYYKPALRGRGAFAIPFEKRSKLLETICACTSTRIPKTPLKLIRRKINMQLAELIKNGNHDELKGQVDVKDKAFVIMDTDKDYLYKEMYVI